MRTSFCIATRTTCKLAVGLSAILTLSGVPSLARAQSHFVQLSDSDRYSQRLAQDTAPQSSESIDRLEAAVLTLDNRRPRDTINLRRRLAYSYHELGEQARAVEMLDSAVAIMRNGGSSSYASPVRMAPAYIAIGEAEIAEQLLTEAINSATSIRQLKDVAETYRSVGEVDLAVSALSRTVDFMSELSVSKRSLMHSIGTVAHAYSQIENASIDLTELMLLAETTIETCNRRCPDSTLSTALSLLSIAQSKHGDAKVAEQLAARAFALVQESEQTGYIVAEVATAYGYVEDTEVAESALTELMVLAESRLSSVDPVEPAVALGAIAKSYAQIGNQKKSEEALAVLSDAFGDSLFMMYLIFDIHEKMNNEEAKERVIQQMFEKLPLLREVEFTISDVTSGYAGIDGLVEAYVYTTDDAVAQERLIVLESFFEDALFDPLGIPGQLNKLVWAASRRGDSESAQRLLAEATDALESGESGIELRQRERATVIRILSSSYGLQEDNAFRQAGLDRLQRIANDTLEPEQKAEVSDVIIRDRAWVQ